MHFMEVYKKLIIFKRSNFQPRPELAPISLVVLQNYDKPPVSWMSISGPVQWPQQESSHNDSTVHSDVLKASSQGALSAVCVLQKTLNTRGNVTPADRAAPSAGPGAGSC